MGIVVKWYVEDPIIAIMQSTEERIEPDVKLSISSERFAPHQ